MNKWIDEFKYDLNFIKSHTLQPQWYKILKVFILLGFLVGYWILFGWAATLIFLAVFLLLSGLVHLVYRSKTRKYTQSWLDFVVVTDGDEVKAQSIGKYYYAAVVINAALALFISQVLT